MPVAPFARIILLRVCGGPGPQTGARDIRVRILGTMPSLCPFKFVTSLFAAQGVAGITMGYVGDRLQCEGTEPKREAVEPERQADPVEATASGKGQPADPKRGPVLDSEALPWHKAAGARLAASDLGGDGRHRVRVAETGSARLLERQLEKDLRRVYNRVTGKYHIVVGPRGCGKTTTAIAAARGRRDASGTTLAPSPGVLLIHPKRRGDTVKHILHMLAPPERLSDAAIRKAFDAEVERADLRTLVPIFKAAIEAHRSQVRAKAKADKSSEPAASDDGWVPTVIIDADRNLEADDVTDLCRVAKLLACEMKIAAVVLVLADAGTLGVPEDVSRQARAVFLSACPSCPTYFGICVDVVASDC